MAGNNSIQFLRGTSAQRSNLSEQSLPGQPLYETDTNKLYVGDGSTAVNDLKEIVANDVASKYNLGAYDTYVDNGNGTVTVTRKTGYLTFDGDSSEGWFQDGSLHGYRISIRTTGIANAVANIRVIADKDAAYQNNQSSGAIFTTNSGTQGKISIYIYDSSVTDLETAKTWLSANPVFVEYETSTSYTENLPANVPLNTLDVNGEQFVRNEWEKTLNLADWDGTEDYTNNQNTWTYLFIARLSVGVNYHLTIKNFSQNRLGHGGLFLVQSDTPNIPVPYQSLIRNPDQIVSWEYSPNGDKTADFTPSKEYVCLGIDTDGTSKTFHVEDIMLVEGSHAYPYQPYNGAIVHERELNDALEDYLPRTGTAAAAYKFDIQDTRNDTSPPSYYFALDKKIISELKSTQKFVNPPPNTNNYSFFTLITVAPWVDSSGGDITQFAVYAWNSKNTPSVFMRKSISTEAWGEWIGVTTEEQLDDALENYLPLSGGTMSGDINMAGNSIVLRDTAKISHQSTGNVTNLENSNFNVPDGQISEAGQRVYSPNNPPPSNKPTVTNNPDGTVNIVFE